MDKKLYRQKEMHFFFFDNNGYYSSTSRKYILLKYNSHNINEDENLLIIGLYLSLKTNSIFVLPQFKCNHCSNTPKYCKNIKFCSFIEFWSIRELNKSFYNNYRENVYCIIYNS